MAAPVTAFTLWNPDAVKITPGLDYIGMYNKTRSVIVSGARHVEATSLLSIPAGDSPTCMQQSFRTSRTTPAFMQL